MRKFGGRLLVLVMAALAPACGSSGAKTPALPGALLDQQTVKVSPDTPSMVTLGSGTQAATLTFPPGATSGPENVQVALSSGVDKKGGTPANGTVVQIVNLNLTFMSPVVLQQIVPVPPDGKVYRAGHAQAADAAWTIGDPATLVGPAPADGGTTSGLEVFSIDIGGTGIWTIVLEDASDGGQTPDSGSSGSGSGGLSGMDAAAATGGGGNGGGTGGHGDSGSSGSGSGDSGVAMDANSGDNAMQPDGLAQDGGSDSMRSGGSCVDGGTGLASFHPSNLPSPVVVPSDAPALPMGAGGSGCTIDSDALTTSYCANNISWKIAAVTLSDGREAAVAYFATLTILAGQSITVTGSRPVILAADGPIEIDGSIGNGQGTTGWWGGGAPGPAAPTRTGICPLDTGAGGGRAGGNGAYSALGAGGGGFCGVGGLGSAPAGATPASGGMTYGTPELVPLVGGSSGGSTDAFNVINHGGAAVELVSGTSILIGAAGFINVGGGEGNQSGNGAGSGGAILLEAPSVTVRGVLAANGGAGSAGGVAQYGQATDQPALGSTRPPAIGGNGSAGATASGGNGTPDTTPPGWYAGGGGGAGRIRINTGCGGTLLVVPSAVISPYESTGCYTKGALQ
jgi:hypothetical protein